MPYVSQREDDYDGRGIRQREEAPRAERIKLSYTTWVDPTLVKEVRVHGDSGTVTVRMHDGVKHYVPNDIGLGAWDTAHRLTRDIARARLRALGDERKPALLAL
jgi:hypothetical protein